MGWNVLILNENVQKELDALAPDMRARFTHVGELVENVGPMRAAGTSHVKHIRGPLWEMRMRGRDGISRALCVVCEERRQVVVAPRSSRRPGRHRHGRSAWRSRVRRSWRARRDVPLSGRGPSPG